MLVLSRRIGERIRIGDGITLSIVAIQGKRVQIAIEAPQSVAIRRSELVSLPSRRGEQLPGEGAAAAVGP